MLDEAQGLWRGAGLQRGPRRAVRPGGGAPARGDAARGDRDRASMPSFTLGRHESLIGELETLTSAHPIRERLWSQRMLALYRSGRQAEALRVYPGPAVVAGGRARDRAGARRVLDGARHPGPGPRAVRSWPRPRAGTGPRPRGRHPPALAATSTRYQVRVPASRARGPLVGRDRESALLRDWWTSVGKGDGPPPAGRRRPGHRQDAARGRAGARRRGRGRARPVGPLRRGSRGAVPTLRRSARALLPVALGGPDLAHARLAAHRALPPGPRACASTHPPRRTAWRPRQRALPILRGGDGDAQRAGSRWHHPAGDRRPALRPISRPCCCSATCCGASTGEGSASSGCSSTPRCRPNTGCAPCWRTSGPCTRSRPCTCRD